MIAVRFACEDTHCPGLTQQSKGSFALGASGLCSFSGADTDQGLQHAEQQWPSDTWASEAVFAVNAEEFLHNLQQHVTDGAAFKADAAVVVFQQSLSEDAQRCSEDMSCTHTMSASPLLNCDRDGEQACQQKSLSYMGHLIISRAMGPSPALRLSLRKSESDV